MRGWGLVALAAAWPVLAAANPLISVVNSDQAMYRPGESPKVTVTLVNTTGASYSGRIVCFLRSRGSDVSPSQTIAITPPLAPGATTKVTAQFTPPPTLHRGYLVEIWLWNDANQIVDSAASAIDVSTDWTKFPRYGFVSSFGAADLDGKPIDPHAVVDSLNRYHLNGLQFYDVNYEHHLPFTGGAQWNNQAGLSVSRDTVTGLIAAAHQYRMVAMNYNTVGSSSGRATPCGSTAPPQYLVDSKAQTQWGLFNSIPINQQTPWNQQWCYPSEFWQFDPDNANWQSYLFAQEKPLFQTAAPGLGFDGWHIDSFGAPGDKLTFGGARLASDSFRQSFADFTHAAKAQLDVSVVFNSVNGFAQDQLAAAGDAEFLYSEVWSNSGTPDYNSIFNLIQSAKVYSSKPVVLPGYMNSAIASPTVDGNAPFDEASVRLVDAVMMAAGGIHFELGNTLRGERMLSSDYFPGPQLAMSPSLQAAAIDLSNFAVAYQNLLRDGTADAVNGVQLNYPIRPPIGRKTIAPRATMQASPGALWFIRKSKAGFNILHVINLVAKRSIAWDDPTGSDAPPPVLDNVPIKMHYTGALRPDGRLMHASPDIDHGKGYPLPYQRGSDGDGPWVSFVIPRMQYWDMIWLETSALFGNDYHFDAFGVLGGSQFNDSRGLGVLPTSDTGGGWSVANACCHRWASYHDVDFGRLIRAGSVSMRVASALTGTVELRLDGPSGPLIASMPVATGGWQTWATQRAPLTGRVSGNHDLYLVFPDNAVNVNWLQFLPAPSPL